LPEWEIEQGIGETRAARIEGDRILEARIFLEGVARAGTRLEARLKKTGRPALAEAAGQEYLLPKGASAVTEGERLTLEVTREAIPGAEPWKRPLAVVTDRSAGPPPATEARELRFPASHDELGNSGWWEMIEEARSGVVRFPGGELRVSPTPAMTLIDVDGHLPLLELGRAGAEAAALAILRHGIGGSIGIDLPIVGGKAERQAIAAAVDAILPQPFERTAVNGFGFLQIIRPRRHASLFELAQDRAAFEARALLRRIALEDAGPKRLVAHPAVITLLKGKPGWLDALAHQIGGAVALRADAALPMSGGYAEKL